MVSPLLCPTPRDIGEFLGKQIFLLNTQDNLTWPSEHLRSWLPHTTSSARLPFARSKVSGRTWLVSSSETKDCQNTKTQGEARESAPIQMYITYIHREQLSCGCGPPEISTNTGKPVASLIWPDCAKYVSYCFFPLHHHDP